MRGKEKYRQTQAMQIGITPAYAGKRQDLQPIAIDVWDHPRVCGEKPISFVSVAANVGSPPRMRGKAFGGIAEIGKLRITPAYAGKRWILLLHSDQ